MRRPGAYSISLKSKKNSRNHNGDSFNTCVAHQLGLLPLLVATSERAQGFPSSSSSGMDAIIKEHDLITIATNENLDVTIIAIRVSHTHHRRGEKNGHFEGNGDPRALKYSICLKIT